MTASCSPINTPEHSGQWTPQAQTRRTHPQCLQPGSAAQPNSLIEEIDGQRKHAIVHYLDLIEAGRVDLSPILTHAFGLDRWRDAFLAIANQGESGAVKVAIDQR